MSTEETAAKAMGPFERVFYSAVDLMPEKLALDFGLSAEAAQELSVRMAEEHVVKNDRYQVTMRLIGPHDEMVHLSVRRIDREPVHDWRDLQAIKNALVGEECEGVEIYPAERRLVDNANQYHLWVFRDPQVLLPFGFGIRMVTENPGGQAKQRPFAPDHSFHQREGKKQHDQA